MCKAIEEMLADAKAEGQNLGLTQGLSQGRLEGKTLGLTQGRLEGRATGILEGKFESLAELVKDGILDLSEAARRVDMSVEEFEEKMR